MDALLKFHPVLRPLIKDKVRSARDEVARHLHNEEFVHCLSTPALRGLLVDLYSYPALEVDDLSREETIRLFLHAQTLLPKLTSRKTFKYRFSNRSSDLDLLIIPSKREEVHHMFENVSASQRKARTHLTTTVSPSELPTEDGTALKNEEETEVGAKKKATKQRNTKTVSTDEKLVRKSDVKEMSPRTPSSPYQTTNLRLQKRFVPKSSVAPKTPGSNKKTAKRKLWSDTPQNEALAGTESEAEPDSSILVSKRRRLESSQVEEVVNLVRSLEHNIQTLSAIIQCWSS